MSQAASANVVEPTNATECSICHGAAGASPELQLHRTGCGCVEMGAVLGRVPPEGRAHLRAYARDIGLAFQIADDLLDVEGDEERAGKALRKDEVQGKQTFVTLMGVEQARAQATMLVEQAGRHLASHGEDARLLVELARFIVKRDH